MSVELKTVLNYLKTITTKPNNKKGGDSMSGDDNRVDIIDAIIGDLNGSSLDASAPTCPHCEPGPKIDCAECSHEWFACVCAEEDQWLWWCNGCGDTFQQVLSLSDDDQFDGEPADNEPFCRCVPQNLVCSDCYCFYDQKTSAWYWLDHSFAPKDGGAVNHVIHTAAGMTVIKSEQKQLPVSTGPKPGEPSAKGCTCKPEKVYFCGLCKVDRKGKDDVWLVAKPSTAIGYQKCRHYEKPIVFPDGTKLHGTSNTARQPSDHIPDLGVYLDSCWRPASPAYIIDWPDYGIPKWDDAAISTIRAAFDFAKAGNFVEVGCIGGHGRTGTVLAAMAILGGVDPMNAVSFVRSNYCSHAIESAKQEWWVESFAYQIGMLDTIRVQPTTTYAGWEYGSFGGSVIATHQIKEHFVTWRLGDASCDQPDCSYWDHDVSDFKANKWPSEHEALDAHVVKVREQRAQKILDDKNKKPTTTVATASQSGNGSGILRLQEVICHCGDKYLECACTNRRHAECKREACAKLLEAADTVAKEIIEKNDLRSDRRCVRPGCNNFLLWNATQCDRCNILYSSAFWTNSLHKSYTEPTIGTETMGFVWMGTDAGWVPTLAESESDK